MTNIKLLLLHYNTWKHFTECKQMSLGSFTNVTYKLFIYESYIFSMFV